MTAVELDPDPTPTCTPWQEYLTAAQGLDAVHRTIVSESAAATRTISSARAELALARTRLGAQRHRLVAESVQAGVPLPPLDPDPGEQDWARATVAGSPAEALSALSQGHTLIEAADAHLLGAEPPAPGPRSPAPWLIALVVISGLAVALLCGLLVIVGLRLA